MNGLKIIPLRVEHRAQVCKLLENQPDSDWGPNDFEDEANRSISRFFLLFDGETLVAVGGFWIAADEAQVMNLFVHPAYRRKGHARRLMEHLVDQARNEKCRVAQLEVRAENAAAKALYEKFGFSVRYTRKKFYSNPVDDALVMERHL